jgi:hypothetical protein
MQENEKHTNCRPANITVNLLLLLLLSFRRSHVIAASPTRKLTWNSDFSTFSLSLHRSFLGSQRRTIKMLGIPFEDDGFCSRSLEKQDGILVDFGLFGKV